MATLSSETLRLTNCRVRGLMQSMLTAQDETALVKPDEFDALLAEVTQAAGGLRGLPQESMQDADLAKEISAYRDSLENLLQILPALQKRLLAQKMRLEAQRNHLAAASAWANASGKTL